MEAERPVQREGIPSFGVELVFLHRMKRDEGREGRLTIS
jgi:hypothetical protein